MTAAATNPDAAPLDDERTALIARGLEELLAEANLARHQAQTAERARNAFLGTISHEFRTPLTAVQGFADLLADGPPGALSEAQCRQVGRIRAASDHLLGLIDEILGFAQNQAGRADLRLCTVDLADVARDVAVMVEPLAAAKELRFTPRIPAGPIPFRTDPGKFRQILLNLAANAVKFTETGDVGLELEVVDQWVLLRVSDTGIGIAPGHVEQVFEAFWQVDHSSGRAGGTGLGLAVARQLAVLLEGEVTLHSELGRGSVFTVRLPPLSPPDAAVQTEAPPRALAGGAPGGRAQGAAPPRVHAGSAGRAGIHGGMMANPTFAEAIDLIARGLRQAVPSHAHLNGAAARIDHLGRRLHGLGCVRDREIAACFTAAIAELDASHGFEEGARGDAVRRAAGQLKAALAYADEGVVAAGVTG